MKDVVCLYEASGHSARPWAEAGHDVYCYDILHERKLIEPIGKGKLGGKSAKTKSIRSASPRGIAKAIWEYNA